MRPQAALSQLAADLEVGEPTYAGVGDQGYGPVAPDFLQAQLRALAGQLPAHGWPASWPTGGGRVRPDPARGG